MNGRTERKTARARRALAVRLGAGVALAVAAFGVQLGAGRDVPSDAAHAESPARMHVALANRSVGELFPLR